MSWYGKTTWLLLRFRLEVPSHSSVYTMRWGLGKPINDIDISEEAIIHHYFLDLWVDMWFYTFSVGLSKFVILGFYWRTFSLSIIRQPIRILFICSVCWIIVRCQPIRKFWQPQLAGECPLTPMMSLFAAGIPHFLLEVAILLCPLIEIYRLHISTARKFAVAAMFASGLLVCGSALGTIVHTVSLDQKEHQDLTYDGIDDQIWAVCDVNLASFATSLPLLRPILRSFGDAFSGPRSDGSPSDPNSLANANSVPTVGSAPKKRHSRPLTTTLDTESMIELAGYLEEGQGKRTSTAHAINASDRDEGREEAVRDGIHVRKETRVDFSNV
ncbi:ubiquinone biosynthetic process [Stemphylium lycopersici]|nr:ubiquinone biosynthetic process [Stemphylium lycopersici]